LKEARAAPPAKVVYHHNTDIPVYDLPQLNAMVKLPASVRMLVASRQRAMQNMDRDMNMNYLELWAKQWELETGDQADGRELQNRLHQLQARPSVRHRLKQVMVMETNFIESENNTQNREEMDSERFEFEAPAIGFRNTIFPRVEEQALDVLVRRKVGNDGADIDDKETWLETLGHSRLGLPIVGDLKEIVNEDGIKFRPKVSYLDSEEGELTIQGDLSEDSLHYCPHPICSSQFQNYNNFLFHLSVHKNTAGLIHQNKTFRQKTESYRICTDLVMECFDRLSVLSQF